MSRERIIEKIKKLLAVTEERGASNNEATAAALAAQRLIVQYDIEQWEIHEEESDPMEAVFCKPTPRKWRWYLADVIAPAFRCKYHQQAKRSPKNGKLQYMMVFYGYRMDAIAASLTFNSLYKYGNKVARRYAKDHEKGSYNAYVLGFVTGVQMELEKQTVALAVVTPKKVNDSYAEQFTEFKEANVDIETGNGFDSHYAFYEGKHKGIEAVRSRRMKNTDSDYAFEGV